MTSQGAGLWRTQHREPINPITQRGDWQKGVARNQTPAHHLLKKARYLERAMSYAITPGATIKHVIGSVICSHIREQYRLITTYHHLSMIDIPNGKIYHQTLTV